MKKLTTLLIASVLLHSCSLGHKDPLIPNEEELITTFILTLSPSGGGQDIVFSFKDIDGDGPELAQIISPSINSQIQYNAKVSVLNQAVEPNEDITDEIIAEAEDHQFFYQSNSPDLTVVYNDSDFNNLPIGIDTKIFASKPGTYQLKIILRHMPDKMASGVVQGDITNAGGESDIEINFTVNAI